MNAKLETLWRQASLPAVEPGFQPGGRNRPQNPARGKTPGVSRHPPSFPGGRDAALHGRQGCLPPLHFMKPLPLLALLSGLLALPLTLFANDEQTLGSLLYSDANLSLNRNQSCASCHSLAPAKNLATGLPLPAPGFVDSANVETNTPVSRGSVSGSVGGLNAPSAGYAAFTPEFYWDAAAGEYRGGQFWNGRAATLEAQAAGPFLNPLEMAMPSEWAVITRLKENASYRQLFDSVYGINLDAIPANELASPTHPPPPGVRAAYAAATQAIAEFERTRTFNKFNSKFDFWLAGQTPLSASELRGFNLFTNKAGCAACHVSTPGVDSLGRMTSPLFTDFSYDNLGLPRNWKIPGTPAPDPGLGGRADIAATPTGAAQLGKHRNVTLRNIALTPPYGHNGVFERLEQITHFYNTRNNLGRVDANTNSAFGVFGWPEPEVPQNVNQTELGNLGLLPWEEADLVAFMKTLTDDYPGWGGDPNVPPGTPSPFVATALPQIPTRLEMTAPGVVRIMGHLGKTYRIEHRDSLVGTNSWQPLGITRLIANGATILDTNAPAQPQRLYRAAQLP